MSSCLACLTASWNCRDLAGSSSWRSLREECSHFIQFHTKNDSFSIELTRPHPGTWYTMIAGLTLRHGSPEATIYAHVYFNRFIRREKLDLLRTVEGKVLYTGKHCSVTTIKRQLRAKNFKEGCIWYLALIHHVEAPQSTIEAWCAPAATEKRGGGNIINNILGPNYGDGFLSRYALCPWS